jgi:hypothetical protein
MTDFAERFSKIMDSFRDLIMEIEEAAYDAEVGLDNGYDECVLEPFDTLESYGHGIIKELDDMISLEPPGKPTDNPAYLSKDELI